MPPSFARVSGNLKRTSIVSLAMLLGCAIGACPTTTSATTIGGSTTSPVNERVNPTNQTASYGVDRTQSETAARSSQTSVGDAERLTAKKVDPTFSIAVLPDTQQEVLRSSDGRFINRTRWLVAKRKSLDLRYVTHTGDVVNWDTPNHSQYSVARNAFNVLNTAGIPYSLSIGNHDTQATGVGGAARDASRSHALQRDTHVFNSYLNRQTKNLAGAYQAGRVDNTFHTFSAGGKGWLVLNLELWPRRDVVAWAERVVKSHPKHNVIIVTHAYLSSKGGVGNSNGGYGDTSPQYLRKHLVGKYKNVRMVFSGHTGRAGHWSARGTHGNRIDYFLTTLHSTTTNPVRLVKINTKTGTVTSKVYAPWTKATSYKVSLKHRHWVG